MRIHEISIENFRGIKCFKWRPTSSFASLIGPGDSGKSTVLDALELAFSPRWSHVFTDNDFYTCSISERDSVDEIIIQVTVVDPPQELLRIDSFMAYTRGVDSESGAIVDEPDSESPALTVELRVDRSLEPVWQVVADRQATPAPLRSSHRASFGVIRIGGEARADLRWSRTSGLLRMTNENDQKPVGQKLVEAARAAKQATASSFEELIDVTDQVTTVARSLRAIHGVTPLTAALNADTLQIKEGSVSLHQNDVPLERYGLGSRRLTSIAVQLVNAVHARVLLIDEIESGLEPHRIRHLLLQLKKNLNENPSLTQVFATTHSPVVLRELQSTELAVIRRNTTGMTEANIPGSEMQGVLRKNAEAFLAPAVLVCEGITEQGFTKGVLAHAERNGFEFLAEATTADAGGEKKVTEYANAFARLGYKTGAFYDHDTDYDFSSMSASVTQIRCDEGLSLEKQIANSLSALGLKLALEHGASSLTLDGVTMSLEAFGCPRRVSELIFAGEEITDFELSQARSALGQTASKNKNAANWFKSMDRGERLAEIAIPNCVGEPAERIINALRAWASHE
ncbi:ATP-dependent nuclease [Glutamicibacter nicotianae]|uniref:ATPase AAA-type core domain-containing protein n=1 Tax=Glutamicibacter nicotianae TaxID=37929 RepID=A0ABQ0RMT5_GLUNI|nr:ATP-binding protein [Glutamicibacter nicotianae]GEC13103.1 hypothetical protein ANI01nite_23060 [Glutamicibacter nicotianae]